MHRRLGEALVAWGAVTPGELAAALAVQEGDPRVTRRRLGQVLLDQAVVSEWTLASALAEIHGLPCSDLGLEPLDEEVSRRIPQRVAERFLVLPLWERSDVVRVAVSDPIDVVAVDDLRLRLPAQRIEVVVAPESQIRERIQRVWSAVAAHYPTDRATPESRDEQQEADADINDAGAVAAVHQILSLAARQRASDVHVEPLRDQVIVRFRQDGRLRHVLTLPKSGQATVTSRIKILAGMDIVERRVPQDGRARLRIEGRDRNLRISSLPSIHGEKLVIRLLSDVEHLPALPELGLSSQGAGLLRGALREAQGLVLVTGPTGSGKTTTLYSAIKEVLDASRNLIALEDPVEVELPGVTQVQVNERIGPTFATALRSCLRQDPDVIMVGEIRDEETAELAVRACLTGHLVLSTLHTVDAPSALIRLVEMGVPAYLVSAATSLAMAQRLVRTSCRSCLQPVTPDPDTRARLGLAEDFPMWEGVGCSQCQGTGYQGRVAVCELLAVNPEVRAALLHPEDEAGLRQAARTAGYVPMLEEGLRLAREGLTSPAELLRAIGSRSAS